MHNVIENLGVGPRRIAAKLAEEPGAIGPLPPAPVYSGVPEHGAHLGGMGSRQVSTPPLWTLPRWQGASIMQAAPHTVGNGQRGYARHFHGAQKVLPARCGKTRICVTRLGIGVTGNRSKRGGLAFRAGVQPRHGVHWRG